MGGVVGGIVSGIGGLIGGRQASSAASAAAAAQRDAANRASQMAQFRPVGITTGFGSSRFTVNDLGQVTEAGYELTPELQSLRNRILGLATGGGVEAAPRYPGLRTGGPGLGPDGRPVTQAVQLTTGGVPDVYSIGEQLAPIGAAASSLFGLGGQLIPTSVSRTASPEALALQQRFQQAAAGLAPTDLSMAASPEAMALSQQLRGLSQQVTPTSYDPTAAAQQYFEQQRALLEPSRQAQLAQTRGRLFGTGRGGLGVTTATGGAPTSPELQAYYNAIAQQDAALAARSTDVARQRLAEDIALGTQLGGTALTTQQRAEQLARERTLGNLEASLGFGGQAIATGLAGEDVARQRFAQDLALGTGLFGTAGQFLSQIPALQSAYLGPIQSQLGLASMIEGLGQQPFQLSQELAAAQAGAGRGAGAAYLSGMGPAIALQQRADSYSPLGSFLSGAGSSLSGLFGGAGGGGFGGGFNPFNRYGSGLFDLGRVPTSVNRSWGSME